MTSYRVIGKRISPENCVPDYIANPYPGLSGGWSEMNGINGEEKEKVDKWIIESLHDFHIYFDKNDIVKILKVYRQVVSGINYWILFQLDTTGDLFTMEVYEPLAASGGKPRVTGLRSCS